MSKGKAMRLKEMSHRRKSAMKKRVGRALGFALNALGVASLLGCLSCATSGMIEYTSFLGEPVPSGLHEGKGLAATWMGTAAILLDDGETQILIDPFVSRPGILPVALGRPLEPLEDAIDAWIQRLNMQEVAAILVTHSHYDHSMDAPFFAKRLGAPVFGSESTAQIVRGAGLGEEFVRIVETGEPMRMGDFEVTFMESRHGKVLFGRVPFPGEIKESLVPSVSAWKYREGGTFSVLIRHPQGTVLHHGSAGFRDGMCEEGVKADVALLCLAGRGDTEQYLQEVVDRVGAVRVIPIHFDTFFRSLHKPIKPLINVDLDGFFRDAERHVPELEVETLPVGKPVMLFRSKPDET